MNRDQLEHILRAAGAITGRTEWVGPPFTRLKPGASVLMPPTAADNLRAARRISRLVAGRRVGDGEAKKRTTPRFLSLPR